MYITKIRFASVCILVFSFLNFHCTKIDTTTIGAGLIPAVDNVNTFDTVLTVIANNFDTVSTDCANVYPSENHVLGYIGNDQYFGTTIASIFTQFSAPNFPFFFPASAPDLKLDSVVLVLSYRTFYGDTTLPQKVNVYRFDSSFVFDSSTCSQKIYNPLLLGSAIFTPQSLNDTARGFNDTSANELRIRLNDAFGQDILATDTSRFATDSLFRDFLKGFAIVPDAAFGGNALTYYNLVDTNSKLALYFRYSKDAVVDSPVVQNFRFTSTTASANNIIRNHSGSEIESNTSHPEPGDNFIYIQTTPGTYAELKIPGLNLLSNRIIHRAELVMDQAYSASTNDEYLTAPDILYLQIKDTGSTLKPIPCDFNTSTGTPNLGTFGGVRATAKDNSGNNISRYTFNITRYVQKIVTNKNTNYTLKLSAPDYIINSTAYIDECNQTVSSYNYAANYLAAGRVKLVGGNSLNPLAGMRLRIIYSKL